MGLVNSSMIPKAAPLAWTSTAHNSPSTRFTKRAVYRFPEQREWRRIFYRCALANFGSRQGPRRKEVVLGSIGGNPPPIQPSCKCCDTRSPPPKCHYH